MKHKTSRQKKDDKNILWYIAVFALIVIAIVAVGFFHANKEEIRYDTYNHFNFEKKGNYWITNVEYEGSLFEAPFNYHPQDLLTVPYDTSITKFMLNVPHSQFIIAVKPDAGSTPVLAGVNIGRITGKLYGVPTSSALYIEEGVEYNETNFPTVNCADATADTPILWMNTEEPLPVIKRDENNPNCIIVGGNNTNGIIRSSDVLVYKMLGIML